MAQGRPKAENLSRFNIDTGLLSSRKFIRLKRELNLSESETLHILTRLWWFAADNYAFWPTLEKKDFDIVAEFCNWNNDPQTLIDALIKAEFLENDFTIHDWFRNQPLADKLVYDRVEYAAKHGITIPVHPQWKELHQGLEINTKDFPSEKSPKSLPKRRLSTPKRSKENGIEVNENENPIPPFQNSEIEIWNQLCQKHDFLETVQKMTSTKNDKLEVRRKEKLFDWTAICEAVDVLCTAGRFPTAKGFSPQFKWLIYNEDNYLNILSQAKVATKSTSTDYDKFIERSVDE